VRLFEHPDFEQAILQAAQHLGVSEQFVEKDHYATEILRIIALELGDKTMFKGGTSLSKGWGLISRFSEDIDLFLNPDKFEPRPGTNTMDRILKELAESVAAQPRDLSAVRERIFGLGVAALRAIHAVGEAESPSGYVKLTKERLPSLIHDHAPQHRQPSNSPRRSGGTCR
jgi:hypothetical protein